ncbi:hypothetical protein O181_118825 [Austropuccinia psidii MF-1]|uniref:Transposase Tc1-like domain-containing protein n=1 Tax=Austropuccinia psidii MF-1 TaxID=1389203 RepID=A0A9Q3PZR5_9BASI|nr:hypothetical protein [Austropuccinia psidii MF-1]
MDINKPPILECMPPYQTQGIQGRIIGMHDAGASIRTITRHLGVPPTTVHDTVRRFWERGHLDNLPIPGRPCKLNERDLRELARVIQQDRRETLVSITNMLTVNVSINTVRKAIHDVGKRSCIAIKKPYLSPQHMQRRLDFAQAHLHWTIANWSRVVWTNESSFELGEPVTQKRVWRTTAQKFDLESMAVNHRSGR